MGLSIIMVIQVDTTSFVPVPGPGSLKEYVLRDMGKVTESSCQYLFD